MLCLVFFAFTTILGWDYYSGAALNTLLMVRRNASRHTDGYISSAYSLVLMTTVSAVWTIADIFNGLMAIPNLIALVAFKRCGC